MANYSDYQKRLIKNYYENKETVMLNKLDELVSEIYLNTGKKRQQLWRRVASALRQLNVSNTSIDRLIKKDDPAQLASLIQLLHRQLDQ